MKKIKKIIPILLAMAIVLSLSGCKNNENNQEKNSKQKEETKTTQISQNPVATMQVSYVNASGEQKEGTIKMELYPKKAPETVANFVNLANNGFYNGLTFHRIVKDFMIQGGDPSGNGTGGATVSNLDTSVKKGSKDDYSYTIKGEFSGNKYDNDTKFQAGTLAMARSDYSALGLAEEGYNSACSQFFIMNTDNSSTNKFLQGQYAAFGKVIEGYDVVLDISETEVEYSESGSEKSLPKVAPKIKSLSVETFGTEYKIPQTINAEETEKKINEAYNKLLQQMYDEQQ